MNYPDLLTEFFLFFGEYVMRFKLYVLTGLLFILLMRLLKNRRCDMRSSFSVYYKVCNIFGITGNDSKRFALIAKKTGILKPHCLVASRPKFDRNFSK